MVNLDRWLDKHVYFRAWIVLVSLYFILLALSRVIL